MFVAYMYQEGFKAETIRSHLSAIAYSHKMQGFPSPTDSFLIKKLIKGAGAQSPGGDVRFPVTISILQRLIKKMSIK